MCGGASDSEDGGKREVGTVGACLIPSLDSSTYGAGKNGDLYRLSDLVCCLMIRVNGKLT
jgi:hypothetical protein